jgi:sterol 3beta-glucosyltransferase
MNIAIQTWGSNGDIRPLIALAHGLQQAGHRVTLAVTSIDNQSYQSICEQLKIRYLQIPRQVEFNLEAFAEQTAHMYSWQWLKALLEQAYFPLEPTLFETAQQLAATHDCLIGHHFLYPLKLAALQQNKPFFSVTYCHAAIPNPLRPPLGLPNLGISINHLSWRLLDLAFNVLLRKPLTRLWQAQGLVAPRYMLSELLTSQQLNLVAVDAVFCSPQQWQAHHRCCGFLNLQEDQRDWLWPASLTEFLAQGEAPVYMTFGSLQQAAPEWSMDLFLRAAELSGCRAIIQISSPRFQANTRQDNLYFIGKHPHQPVFAHCAAVVHHGGAGTSHAATRAGCPSVAVPFMDEQLFWAKQLQKHGIAGKPLASKTVTAESLALAIRSLSNNHLYRQRAQQLAMEMRKNNGVSQAVELIATAYRHWLVNHANTR